MIFYSFTFANDWKDTIVLPIIKKASLDKNTLKNYRPISNLSFISKITEKAALTQIGPYIESNSMLPSYQNAYRKFHGTETANIKLINDILWNMENQKITSVTAIDLSAAFDTVDHDTLLNVLNKSFGIKDKALDWVESYLRPRRMHVTIDHTSSDPQQLPFSVPQGSVAGPILYTMYASTMQSVVENQSISGYADDHCLYSSFKPSTKDEKKVILEQEDCLRKVKTWMSQNRLKMNDDKTEFILIGHQSQLKKCSINSITVDSSIIRASDHIKYLGVWIDKELNFKHHILKKSRLAAMNLRNISKIRQHLSESSCKTLIQALVISHLDYSNAILADLPMSTLQPAQRIQNYAAKVILGRRKFDSSTDALKDLHWLPIHLRARFKLLLLVHKSIHNRAPSYLKNLLIPVTTTRQTRSSETKEFDLIVPATKRVTFAARSFSVAGPRHWNSLTYELKSIEDCNLFRKKLKTFLFKEYINSK